MFPTFKRLHLLDYTALFVCGVLAGGSCGGLLNVVNGWVSPPYFELIFYYPGGAPSWTPAELYWHSVLQGVVEGTVSGAVISALFAAYVFVISTASCPFAVSIRFLRGMFLTVMAFGGIGGLNGALIGAVLPSSWLPFIPPGALRWEASRWLWVGGAIWGAYLGALVSLIRGCNLFRRDWLKIKRSQEAANAALK